MQADFTTEDINSLPTSLLELKISQRPSASSYLDLAACRFPSSLCELTLHDHDGVPPLEFSTLPRSLKRLDMNLDVPFGCLAALPADLETFEILTIAGDINIQVQDLPRRLKTLTIYNNNLASKSARYLPRTLTSLRLGLFLLNLPHLMPVGLTSLYAGFYPAKGH